MPKWTFTKYSDIQACVTIETALGKGELFVNVSPDEPRVLLDIHEDEQQKAMFMLTTNTAQDLFHWLKEKGIVH